MFNYLKAKLRRSPVKEDALLARQRLDDRVVNVQFVSFLKESGFRKRVLNQHEKTKCVKRLFALALAWTVVLSCLWIALESVEAFELF